MRGAGRYNAPPMLPTRLRGARTHNLKNVDLDIPPGQVVAITGVSGAGKSSLALDTLYAEGQRRFVESFSPYARQFLERLERPPMLALDPVPAAIAVDRRAPIKSSRSTLATMADIEPYLAALFVRESVALCPEHGQPASVVDTQAAAGRCLEQLAGQRVSICALEPVRSAEHYLEVRDQLAREGYRRLLVQGEPIDLDAVPPSSIDVERGAEVIVDRLRVAPGSAGRLQAAIEAAWKRSGGACRVYPEIGRSESAPGPAAAGSGKPGRAKSQGRKRGAGVAREGEEPLGALLLRRGSTCPVCAERLGEPTPGLFSYESPIGACPTCRGFGRTLGIDYDKVVPDPRKTLARGAIRPWSGPSATWERSQLRALCRRQGIPLDVPYSNLTEEHRQLLRHGDGEFDGLQGWFGWLESRTYKMHVRVLLSRYRSYDACRACGGSRLGEASLSFVVGGLNIAAWHALEVSEALARLEALACRTDQGRLAAAELRSRLRYLERVGLGYLSLDRQARTLSGGEAQRVTLTAALGTNLHNALFVLDEPSVGLHASDVAALGALISELGQRGNSVVLIEHDADLIRAADRAVELGPKAGAEGGTICFDGTPAQAARGVGPTARALRAVTLTPKCSPDPARYLEILGATAHNLKDIDVRIPLGTFCALSGPSGSGKSTLADGILYRSLARRLGTLDVEMPEAHREIRGAEEIRHLVLVDQSPLGRTSRGNAATYTKAWDGIRKLFAEAPAAKSQGLSPSHFSFNVAVGRCEACAGEGFETVEMQFLADVRLQCPSCQGQRFKPEVLGVRRAGRSIADVLSMTIEEATVHFATCQPVVKNLAPLLALGLGYLRLGQPLSTLSGGEAQRLKLARSLGQRKRGSLWILDEPSAGLHADEIDLLLRACRHLVDGGASVLVVEHDLHVLSHVDWLIELGPGGGSQGGTVVAAGTPEEIAGTSTKTGRALRAAVALDPAARRRAGAAKDGRDKGERRARPSRTTGEEHGARHALQVRGAREHNLKQVDVDVPHQAMTVVTGPSGSGKSSLAFDVIFAEGQRRFLETLTPYARQFLPTLPRPDVDSVSGVPPSVSLEQRTARSGAKSTVATVTEISHYLRLLYAKLGTLHCPQHDLPVRSQSAEALIERVRGMKGRFEVCAPVVRSRKGTYLDLFAGAARDGIEHAYADGQRVATDDPPRLARTRNHDVSLILAPAAPAKKIDESSLERALSWAEGHVLLRDEKGNECLLSLLGACPECGFSQGELDPRCFSFSTEQGRCPRCEGHGVLRSEAEQTLGRRGRGRKKKKKKSVRASASSTPPPPPKTCPSCRGTRLAPLPRGVRVEGARYDDVHRLSVQAAHAHFAGLELAGRAARIGADILTELARRLSFLCDVGLGYLALDRAASTLSGGEMQRLRLAAQLGTGLTGALYVLDEPTIGLHPRDTGRLLDNLRRLVELGSTVVVVEHDEDTVRAADHLIDLGPEGGSRGGQVSAAGPPSAVLKNTDCPTGRALGEPPSLRSAQKEPSESWLELTGATEHNLQSVDLRVPLERLCVVAGVSGSGKSTLVRKVLLPAVREALGLVGEVPGAFEKLAGTEGLRRAVSVDQSPIGRTPRSVPATFLGIWDPIRRLFAASSDAMVAGFGPARFSFNTAAGGRCATCSGMGAITHEMSFLPDVVQACPTCEGKRFEPQTLGVRYRGHSIGDVLAMSAQQAACLFENHPKIAQPLRTLCDLGTGYITLGQGSHTLSGGEAQRLKLASELTATARHEPTLYVLDEPTTGLHLSDVTRLMNVLDRLVQRGDTLLVIEHHPWVIGGADWIVELGPEGGEGGGRLIAQGRPKELRRKKTPTGKVLRALPL